MPYPLVICNTAIELSGKFKHVKRTKIGSPYVIAEFAQLAEQFKSVAGFEANGGFLLGTDAQLNDKQIKSLPTRDAMLLSCYLPLVEKVLFQLYLTHCHNVLPAVTVFKILQETKAKKLFQKVKSTHYNYQQHWVLKI